LRIAGLEVAGAERQHRLSFRKWVLTAFKKAGRMKLLAQKEAGKENQKARTLTTEE
jgi:hypothetical protein